MSIFTLLLRVSRKGVDCALTVASIPITRINRGLSRRAKPTKVLIVRGDSIGDFVIFSSTIDQYRVLFPDAKLVLLLRVNGNDLYEAYPEIDEVWTIDYIKFSRSFAERLFWWWKMSVSGFDVAINTMYLTSLEHYDQIVRWSGAVRRIALFNPRRNVRQGALAPYTEIVLSDSARAFEGKRHEDLISSLSGKQYCWQPSLRIAHSAETRIFSGLNLPPEGQFGILMPAAQAVYRQWPADLFVRVASRVAGENAIEWYVCGSPLDSELCMGVANGIRAAGHIARNLSGLTRLSDLASLCRGAKLFIGNESAGAHISTALGTPTVVLVGGGHYGIFFPYPSAPHCTIVTNSLPCYHCDWNCTREKVECILGISDESVLEAVNRSLSAGTVDGGR